MLLSRKRKRRIEDPAFEDSLSHDWSEDLTVAEVPIGNRPLWYLGVVAFSLVSALMVRVIYLGANGAYYSARAKDNLTFNMLAPAPRGEIYDRGGKLVAESAASFAAVLDTGQFLSSESLQTQTLDAAEKILGVAPDDLASRVNAAAAQDFSTPVVLAENLTSKQLVNLQALNLSTIKIENSFTRSYPSAHAFSSVLGYVGRVNQADLKENPMLTNADFIGKTGIEAFYDASLRGTPGITIQYKDAKGKVLREEQASTPVPGNALHLTIDGDLQSYFYSSLATRLRSLGRTVGVGIALDPQTGEVLSLVNLPGYDNNVFEKSGTSTAEEIQRLFASADKPLFDRAVDGFYNPGSTIKPLDSVALLKEGVIDPSRTIFSNGALLVPNPYNSSTPTKYLDWRYQGSVNMAGALAQSSDVYFYVTVGGSPAATAPLLNDSSDYGVNGLGINRLYDWWQMFGLGTSTGIDMPTEARGFLPTPDWKRNRFGTPWLLGDTYNVAIGQGDLLVSPFQLIDYVSAIANGGKIYRPYLNAASTPVVAKDLTYLLPQIEEVQKGMRLGVTSPQGTSYSLHDLPLAVCAKTGSAQVQNNAQENALFVGYAPCDHPKIAILVLIEHSLQGSLNAVPVARDVFNWYYVNRILNAK